MTTCGYKSLKGQACQENVMTQCFVRELISVWFTWWLEVRIYVAYASEDHAPYLLILSSEQPPVNASVAAALRKLWRDILLTNAARPSSLRFWCSILSNKVVGTGLRLSWNMKSGSFWWSVGVSAMTRCMALTGHRCTYRPPLRPLPYGIGQLSEDSCAS